MSQPEHHVVWFIAWEKAWGTVVVFTLSPPPPPSLLVFDNNQRTNCFYLLPRGSFSALLCTQRQNSHSHNMTAEFLMNWKSEGKVNKLPGYFQQSHWPSGIKREALKAVILEEAPTISSIFKAENTQKEPWTLGTGALQLPVHSTVIWAADTPDSEIYTNVSVSAP